MSLMRIIALGFLICAACGLRTNAAEPEAKPELVKPAAITKEDAEFFEKNIRPVLVEKCYSCHSAGAKKLQANLLLDSRQGIAAGGDNGAIIVEGDPDKSTLVQALRWTDVNLQMPPSEKLSTRQIEVFEQWVKRGAPDPREAAADAVKKNVKTQLDLEQGRQWWAFQPVRSIDIKTKDETGWAKQKLDHFVFAKLKEHQLEPSPAADRATLIRRASLDLTGLRPTYEEVAAFIRDDSPDAYERLLDKLLASPRYGERWGRYWLDVVRYGEENYTGEATTPPFPFAWRYRDWVIDALNRDVPYDHFVKLQLAADLLPDVPRRDLQALGFLGTAPNYHKDGRLSKDVVETLFTDDWDERVDTVTRGLLGLTVSCARCHDHKFDPIPTADYYALAGVFASTVQAPRPLSEIDPAAETKFMVDTQRIFYRSYASNLLRDDPGSKPTQAREKVIRYRTEMLAIKDENSGLRDMHPELYAHLGRLAKLPSPYPDEPKVDNPRSEGRRRGPSTDPMFHAVYDAGFYLDGTDADFTMWEIRPAEPRDLRVLPGGIVSKPGALVQRGFLSVLSEGDPRFCQGSGRRELADRIFDDAKALSARVIVNRVWAWHFGKPLVGTPSDFGTQGEKPTHPELLDDLAARFIEHGYSLKWLHREIMLSATYRQASAPRADAARVDPANRWLWRMNPRRLDIEAFRDCLLQASGDLEERLGGPSQDLDQSNNLRRTVYARINRERPATLLQLYDFPNATMHSPQRELTTSPLQQLFLMNSGFVQERGDSLARRVESEPDESAKVRALYRRIYARDPTAHELRLASDFLASSNLAQYAQALLATNEVIFWP